MALPASAVASFNGTFRNRSDDTLHVSAVPDYAWRLMPVSPQRKKNSTQCTLFSYEQPSMTPPPCPHRLLCCAGTFAARAPHNVPSGGHTAALLAGLSLIAPSDAPDAAPAQAPASAPASAPQDAPDVPPLPSPPPPPPSPSPPPPPPSGAALFGCVAPCDEGEIHTRKRRIVHVLTHMLSFSVQCMPHEGGYM